MNFKPTHAELSILSILWKEGPATVRRVNEIRNLDRKIGYTNTLKIMQLMHDKGMLTRDTSERSHIYSATLKEDEVKQNVVADMVDTIFEGDTGKLLIHALGSYTPSGKELEEIKSLIKNMGNDASAD